MKTTAALLIVSMLLVGCQTIIDPGPPPPSRDQLVGAWFGLSPNAGYRLDLFANGSAALATAYPIEQGRVRRYTADQWELVDYDLSAAFVPDEVDSRPIYFHARAVGAGRPSLSDISISLSNASRVPAADEFLQESRVKDLLNLLTPSASAPNLGASP
jgi:hypothetical protein